CKKYGLVKGEIGRYKGFVPEIHLRAIEEFKSKFKMPQYAEFTIKGVFARIISMEHFQEERMGVYVVLTYEGRPAFQQDIENYDGIHWYGNNPVPGPYKGAFGRLTVIGLQVCAPVADMDITGMEIDGYTLKRHIPDPIILQPIEGGYLIITAWG